MELLRKVLPPPGRGPGAIRVSEKAGSGAETTQPAPKPVRRYGMMSMARTTERDLMKRPTSPEQVQTYWDDRPVDQKVGRLVECRLGYLGNGIPETEGGL